MSLLIFTSIISSFPSKLASIFATRGPFITAMTFVVGFFIIMAVVFVEQGQRRIPVQYAKRMVGRKMYGGTSTNPAKVNMAGVIPVIFTSSLLFLPILFLQFSDDNGAVAQFVARNFSVGPSRSTCSRSPC